jgi:hypothetical protein
VEATLKSEVEVESFGRASGDLRVDTPVNRTYPQRKRTLDDHTLIESFRSS